MRNYLTRLGWAHGDAEFFSDAEARAMFDLEGIGRSPARFDTKKLENLCGQHIAAAKDAALLHEIEAFLSVPGQPALTGLQRDRMARGLYALKERAKTLPELIEKARFILADRPLDIAADAVGLLDTVSRGILSELTPQLQNASWDRDTLERIVKEIAEAKGVNLGKLAGPLRAALAGRKVTPSVFDMMLVLGRDETLARLGDQSA